MRFPRSIFLKFLAIQVPVFLALIGLGLHFLAEHRIVRAQEQMGARIGSFAGRVATMLADLDIKTEADAANRAIGLLMSDRGVACVQYVEHDKPVPSISAPRMVGCTGADVAQTSVVQVGSENEARELRIGISVSEIEQIRREARDFGGLLTAFSLLLAAMAGAIGFHFVIGRPLSALLGAIRMVAETGRHHRLTPNADDEIGAVVQSFNGMQDSLERERHQVELALGKISRLYNETPALLFTMNAEGVVAGVSEYWLEATGYRRADAVGRSFDLCLSPASRVTFQRDLLPTLAAGTPIHEVSLELVCRDGHLAHMLLSCVEAAFGQTSDNQREFICVMSDVTHLRAVEQQLRDLALTDFLTKLPNRFGMNERMQRLAGMPLSARGRVAVMLIDLDNFKWINDTFGHDAGDQLLIEASRRIRASVRPTDMVARLGGDEFAIICPQIEDAEVAKAIAGRVVEAFFAGIPLDKSTGYVSASIGIALAGGEYFVPETLLRQADQAMYAAKLEGKNRFSVFSSTHQRDEDAKGLMLERIKRALETNAFNLHFQPIIDLKAMKAVGMEALLRLPSDDDSFQSIEELVRVAEESGEMDRLGEWVLNEAARQFAAAPELQASDSFYLTVNVSTRQLSHDFLAQVRKVLEAFPAIKNRLVLEITETAAIRRFDLVCNLLEAIRACGVRIAIDDFGVGYSSLSYISRLPVDMIKLDKSLIMALGHKDHTSEDARKNRALVHTAETLASELGVPLIAEGVETEEIAALLRSIGMSHAQGYLFARPMPLTTLRQWLGLFGLPAETVRPAARKKNAA